MAAIETYLNQRMYDQTYNDMKDEIDRRQGQDDADSSDSASGNRRDTRTTKHNKQWQSAAAAEDDAYHFASYQKQQRQQQLLRHRGKGKDKGGNKVKNWLQDQDFSRHFSFHGTALNTQHMGRGSPHAAGADKHSAQTYKRHQVARLTKGTFFDQCMSGLSWVNKSLPIFLPHTTGRRMWELFIMVLVLYNAISVPLDVSFGMPQTGNIVQYVEYAVDLLYAMDICSTFRTAYVDAQGHLERDTKRIAVRYLKMWFWIDVFATIPYDLLATAIVGGNANKDQLTLLGFLRTPRLLRLGRLVRLLDRLKGANVIRVVMLIAGMAMLSHWIACIWYMLYKYTSFAAYDEWGIFLEGAISEEHKLSAYINGYYQSFLLLLGDNKLSQNNLERIFFITILILGACFYSAVVGQMAVLVANMNTVGLRHRMRQDQTMDVLRYVGLPEQEKTRVMQYFTYITQYSHPASEGLAFLSELPRALHGELARFLYGKALIRIPLFSNLEPAFLESVAGRMKMVTFTPSETIFRAGDLGLEMYIIRKGHVAVVGKHNQLMAMLCMGEYFGEIALFTQAKRTANCVALSNCDLCVLNAYDLKMVMKDFPTSATILEAAAQEKLRQLQVAGRAGFMVEEDDDEEEGYGSYEDEDEAAYFAGAKDAAPVDLQEGGSGDGGGGSTGGSARMSPGVDGDGGGQAHMQVASTREAAGLPRSSQDGDSPPCTGMGQWAGLTTGVGPQPPPDPFKSPFTSPQPTADASSVELKSLSRVTVASPMKPGPVGEGCEIEPAVSSRSRKQATPSPVGEAHEPGASTVAAGRTGSATVFELPALMDESRVLSPGGHMRSIRRTSVTSATVSGSAAAAMHRAGAVGVFKSVEPMPVPLSPSIQAVYPNQHMKITRQGSAASSASGRSTSKWAQAGSHEQDIVDDSHMPWMRTAVSSKGAKVFAAGVGAADGAPSKRASSTGVDPSSALDQLLSPGGRITRQGSIDAPPQGVRIARQSSVESATATRLRHASVEAGPSGKQSHRPTAEQGYGQPSARGPRQDGQLPSVRSRRVSVAVNGDDTVLLSPRGAPNHSSKQSSRRMIRRMSMVAAGSLMPAGSGVDALTAADAEIARLRAELAEARRELDADRVGKSTLMKQVWELMRVVNGLGKKIVDVEGRMVGIEGQVSRLEMAHRANHMMMGGGGGILGATLENETSHLRPDPSGASFARPLNASRQKSVSGQQSGGNVSRSAMRTQSSGGSGNDLPAAAIAANKPTVSLREASQANIGRMRRAAK